MEERSGRRLPSSEDAERALLGALILDAERIPEVAEFVREDDFYVRRHQQIFAALVSLSETNSPVDFVSLGETLKGAGAFHEVGGAEYLIELAGAVTSAAHAYYHGNLVADTATLRRLIREATDLVTEAYDTRPDGESVSRLLDESEQRIFSIGRREQGSGAEPITTAIDETFRRIDASSHRGALTGVTSGFLDLDQLTCGLNAGELIILAARPSMGKTSLALNIVEHAAMSQPEWLNRRPTVLLFSLEMGRQQLVSRMLCSRARVDAHRLRSGRIGADDRDQLNTAADQLRHARIFIDDTSNLTLMTLRSRARRIKAKHELDMIVVDYLQLLSFPRSENRQQEISSISRSLKGIARGARHPRRRARAALAPGGAARLEAPPARRPA